MKRFLIIAAAMLAFMSCTKDIQEINQATDTEGTAFVAGQEVTIRCGNPQTKVSGTENSDKTISFLWEDGDKIKVTVGGASSVFTLVSGAGTKTATFAGTMPASGTTFAIQYPETDPDLSTQTYSEGKLPAGKMKFTASDCTLDATANLTAAYAALRLNLYGLNREVSSIKVTNTTANPNVSYTLNCSAAVRVSNSEETATPFLLVIPSNASSWNFKVEVTAGNATTNLDPVPSYKEGSYTGDGIVITTGTFTTSSAKTFSAGQVLNMPAKLITTIWAPVNCGYDATNTCGLFYQWGRKYGQSTTGTITPVTMSKDDDTEANKGKVGYNSSNYNWFSGNTLDNTLWNNEIKGEKDPCPDGWRVPTGSEFEALITHRSSWTQKDGKYGFYFTGNEEYSEYVQGVFLPAIGYRRFYDGTIVNTSNGYYWTSTPSTNPTTHIVAISFTSDNVDIGKGGRSNGNMVRCVSEYNVSGSIGSMENENGSW